MGFSPHNEFSSPAIEALAHKTPYFLFSTKRISENYHRYKDLFPDALVYYAMKANSEIEVLQQLADLGSGFEVASVYELELLRRFQVPPERIVYGSSIKPLEHIKDFYHYGVRKFAADSLQELEKIAISAPQSSVYIRTVANDTGSVFKFSEKFGVESSDIVKLLIQAEEMQLKPFGISFHVGSQASDASAWEHAITSLIPAFEELKKHDIMLEVLNIGGGYPCVYASSIEIPTLEEIAKSIHEACKQLPYTPKLMLEPGRGIIADTGVAVATVIARVERRGNTWLFLDLGVYNGLFEAMAYQGSTRYPVTSLKPVHDAGESLFALAGPTGDGPDVITREAMLPSDIAVGDKVVIHNVGAYSLVVTSTFNGFPKPKTYTI